MRLARPLRCAAFVASVLAVAVGSSSCGGGGGGGGPDLVLVGFNLPNISGIPLNNPLIFTFSRDIDISSITPDTLRVVGDIGPFFETIVVDGNLACALPRGPNFEDYSDAGMAPGTTYTVSMPVFPAPDTIRSTSGKPLLDAESFQFTTTPTPTFIEPRRPIVHGLPPSAGGRSDDEGCLQNPDNSLFNGTVQFGSGIGALLLCLQNEGSPRILLDECIPTHDQHAVGTPSAVAPGLLDFPAIRVRFNELLDPITVVPYVPTTHLGVNVQLWRVGDTDQVPIPPEQIETNKPLIVQSLSQTEVILVASGPVPQGTYMVDITPSVTDLPGNPLLTGPGINPDPALGGYVDCANNVNATVGVPPGFRFFFISLVLPTTPQAFNESFSSNLNEHGDISSAATEPGLFTETNTGTGDLLEAIPGATPASAPQYTTTYGLNTIGQTTTANWNNGFRLLNLPTLDANADVDSGFGRLKAVWEPYTGDGGDGVFDSPGAGSAFALGTDAVTGNSINGDGIYEYESFHLRSTDTLTVSGSKPLVILCRGDFIVDGTVQLSGGPGGPGLDTDGSSLYTNTGAAQAAGAGGVAGPGGGVGGIGGDPFHLLNGGGTGLPGASVVTLFGGGPLNGGGAGGGGDAPNQQAAGGGGFGGGGGGGHDAGANLVFNGGPTVGDNVNTRLLSQFGPDRGYMPHANASGGTGGGGGGAEDDNGASETGNGTVENGDDGGGGGGGGGGGIYVIAGGDITITGTIVADGGVGGSTYNLANQNVNAGNDGMPGNSDDFVDGLAVGAVPSGDGGPGGGGSGGGIALFSRSLVDLQATSSLLARGGMGGTSGDVDLVGGQGGGGRVLLGALSGGAVNTNGTIDVGGAAIGSTLSTTWRPPIDLASAGVSEWVDMFVASADFDPPFWVDNFDFLTTTNGLVQGVDFDAVLEFQGADDLSPLPAPGVTPSTAIGVTPWSSDQDMVDNKRYVRWRWQFFVADDYPGTPAKAAARSFGMPLPMPSILDLTIPFTR
jgi:hypothetical protein